MCTRTHFPNNIYKADIVEPLPYFRRDVINQQTHFEFTVPSTTNPIHQVNANVPSRFGWGQFPNGYGQGNLVGFFNCPKECEYDPPNMVSKRIAHIEKNSWLSM